MCERGVRVRDRGRVRDVGHWGVDVELDSVQHEWGRAKPGAGEFVVERGGGDVGH